jgi:hypothetical protein
MWTYPQVVESVGVTSRFALGLLLSPQPKPSSCGPFRNSVPQPIWCIPYPPSETYRSKSLGDYGGLVFDSGVVIATKDINPMETEP